MLTYAYYIKLICRNIIQRVPSNYKAYCFRGLLFITRCAVCYHGYVITGKLRPLKPQRTSRPSLIFLFNLMYVINAAAIVRSFFTPKHEF